MKGLSSFTPETLVPAAGIDALFEYLQDANKGTVVCVRAFLRQLRVKICNSMEEPHTSMTMLRDLREALRRR